MIHAVLAVAVGTTLTRPPQTASPPVLLKREYTPNEKLAYAVHAALHSERRGSGLVTWMPEDLDINYDFSIIVEALKADGIAVVRYRRPTMTEVDGETFNTPEKTSVVKTNVDYRLTISPFNEVLDAKNLQPKSSESAFSAATTSRSQEPDGGFVLGFVAELERLSLFVGSLDSGLDLAPKTGFDPVKVGDTWKRTVGYQPQKLKGKNEQAVQRLDYTYTYKGLVDAAKGKVLRVEASLDFSNDLAAFVHQLTSSDAADTGLDKFPLKLKATILFDLDPKTKITLKTDAKSEASFQIFIPDHTDPAYEQRMKAHTTMNLVGRAIVKPTTGH